MAKYLTLSTNGLPLLIDGSVPPKIVTITSGRTLTLADANICLYCNNSGAINITVPTDATVDFKVETEIQFLQEGNGGINFIAANILVTFIRKLGSIATTGHQSAGRYSRTILKKVAANEWRVYQQT